MWCKKRRRNKDSKSQEDNSRPSSNKQTSRKDSTSSAGVKHGNAVSVDTEQSLKEGNEVSGEKVTLTSGGGLKDSLSKLFVQKQLHNNFISNDVPILEDNERNIDVQADRDDLAANQVMENQEYVLQKVTDKDRLPSDSSYIDCKPYNSESDARLRDKDVELRQ